MADVIAEMTSEIVAGSIARAPLLIRQHNVQRIFLVLDETAYEHSGARGILEPAFDQLKISRFTQFALNPKIQDIERGVEQFRSFSPDWVVALGGGTAIDLGKLIGALAPQSHSPRDLVTGRAMLESPGRPLVAIPTTAGTGSEATHFAVAYVEGQKYSLAHRWLLPNFSIVDPLLTHSLPPALTAATGLDAFCQAIESIWAVSATDESLGYATEAARLAIANLSAAVNRPSPASRRAMCQASHLSGKAINISKTTASHALSYALTSRHNIPHGPAVALTLSPLLAYNAKVSDADCADPRGAAHVGDRIATIIELLGANSVSQACARIEGIVSSVGCPTSLSAVGVSDAAKLAEWIGEANAERMANNPRQTSKEALIELLSQY